MFFPILVATTAISHLVSPTVKGEVTLIEDEGTVIIDGTFEGLAPGRHILQLHAEGCSAILQKTAGAHFNPLPDQACDAMIHILEIGEIEASFDGKGSIEVSVDGVSLSGDDSIVGYSLVLHPAGISTVPPSCGRIEINN